MSDQRPMILRIIAIVLGMAILLVWYSIIFIALTFFNYWFAVAVIFGELFSSFVSVWREAKQDV